MSDEQVIFLKIIGVLLGVFIVLIAFEQFRKKWTKKSRGHWVQTVGEVLDVKSTGVDKVYQMQSYDYSPWAIIEYEYRTDLGKSPVENYLVITKKVRDGLEQKNKGDQITVYYNPNNPNEHILEP